MDAFWDPHNTAFFVRNLVMNNVSNLESHKKRRGGSSVLVNSWPQMRRGFNTGDSVRESPAIGDGENLVVC
jgi:hypothetical protein